ncbi:hypothetical protein predicted by Glimmer/Critica [Acetobacter senegalensis]|uniref:Uncharacterized protein n=1 Tax=Acetobacter senegalensis TaxID=446692 RepID=A0A0U5FMV2_9PROT|nr:hypothetical protein [Acetobacter senegalensis]CEF41085.1 hypothetical protein predicted by Glimmer/Critica [Acetobacter senegalensis]
MTDKPTGVFVRLHNGALNEEQIAKLCNPKRTMTESLLAIGTPVTGGELDIVCSIDEDILRDVRELDDDDEEYVTDMVFKPNPDGVDTVPLVRQSDALAKLAEKDAEIARLSTALQSEDIGFTQTIKERDDAEEIIAEMYQAVIGGPPEWSGSFGHRDAVEDIVDYVHALRMRAVQKAGDTHLNNIATLIERAQKNISIAHGGRKMARTIAPILGEIEQEVAILKGPEA